VRRGLIAGLLAALLAAGIATATTSVTPVGAVMPATTVGDLPTCSSTTRGQMFLVTDALLPAALVVVSAGGAVVVPVTCNGTNWIVF